MPSRDRDPRPKISDMEVRYHRWKSGVIEPSMDALDMADERRINRAAFADEETPPARPGPRNLSIEALHEHWSRYTRSEASIFEGMELGDAWEKFKQVHEVVRTGKHKLEGNAFGPQAKAAKVSWWRRWFRGAAPSDEEGKGKVDVVRYGSEK